MAKSCRLPCFTVPFYTFSLFTVRRGNTHALHDFIDNYAALRVTLHSNGVKDVVEIGEALAAEAEEKINANISKVNKIAVKYRQLCAPSRDCEVDTQITSKNGQQRTRTVHVRGALEKYQELEAERSKQLARLWSSWEKTKSEVDELSNQLHEFFERDPSQGTSGISSNSEWGNKEDLDIGRRSKQVVEDMTACEEVSPSLNPDPTLSGTLKS